jgi:D-beta-D-heptose 7-phosphate kinase/D-beta-D-heptose 1-phosphate adenosyltransferase
MAQKRIVVFANGCFDILHCGHLRIFQYARSIGNHVIVGVNVDWSVKELKGNGRPIVGQSERKEIIESIRYVDEVILFNELTPLKLIEEIKPDIIIKGEDWKGKQVIGSHIAEVKFVPMFMKYSTTEIIRKIRSV